MLQSIIPSHIAMWPIELLEDAGGEKWTWYASQNMYNEQCKVMNAFFFSDGQYWIACNVALFLLLKILHRWMDLVLEYSV